MAKHLQSLCTAQLSLPTNSAQAYPLQPLKDHRQVRARALNLCIFIVCFTGAKLARSGDLDSDLWTVRFDEVTPKAGSSQRWYASRRSNSVGCLCTMRLIDRPGTVWSALHWVPTAPAVTWDKLSLSNHACTVRQDNLQQKALQTCSTANSKLHPQQAGV